MYLDTAGTKLQRCQCPALSAVKLSTWQTWSGGAESLFRCFPKYAHTTYLTCGSDRNARARSRCRANFLTRCSDTPCNDRQQKKHVHLHTKKNTSAMYPKKHQSYWWIGTTEGVTCCENARRKPCAKISKSFRFGSHILLQFGVVPRPSRARRLQEADNTPGKANTMSRTTPPHAYPTSRRATCLPKKQNVATALAGRQGGRAMAGRPTTVLAHLKLRRSQ